MLVGPHLTWVCRWINHSVTHRPVRRETYGYLPGCRTSLPSDLYQIVGYCLATEAHVCEQFAQPYLAVKWPGVELATNRVTSQCLSQYIVHQTTHNVMQQIWSVKFVYKRLSSFLRLSFIELIDINRPEESRQDNLFLVPFYYFFSFFLLCTVYTKL